MSRVFLFIFLAKVIFIPGLLGRSGFLPNKECQARQNLRKDLLRYSFSSITIACLILSSTFSFPTISMLSKSGGLTV
jgi:hypothetical protein